MTSDKNKKNSVSGVKSTTKTNQVDKTQGVDNISKVGATSGVSKVGSASRTSGIRGATRLMTFEERERLFEMINEEAKKMSDSGMMTEEQAKVASKAVQQAIDSGLIEEE